MDESIRVTVPPKVMVINRPTQNTYAKLKGLIDMVPKSVLFVIRLVVITGRHKWCFPLEVPLHDS